MPRPFRVSGDPTPAQYVADQAVLDLPGRAQYMTDLLWDYQHTVARYGQFHAWLRRRSPQVLAIWGRNDPYFIPAGAHAYRRDVPNAEVVLLDTGHFALDEEDDVAGPTDTSTAQTATSMNAVETTVDNLYRYWFVRARDYAALRRGRVDGLAASQRLA